VENNGLYADWKMCKNRTESNQTFPSVAMSKFLPKQYASDEEVILAARFKPKHYYSTWMSFNYNIYSKLFE